MTKYIPTIGLEIHAQLKTETKMFCRCCNDPNETRPNVNVCPVCMAHPGTLPVVNMEAVKHVLKVGLALDGQLADFTEFDRKNYFYPDIPKGYQISQYKYPLIEKGHLAGVDITRIHLEEDTARSQHVEDADGGYSVVNYNRAGVPLMELVTEPVIHSAEQAGTFARELQLILQYLGAGDANMEKGEMRVEANISIAPEGSELGTKVEVKNLNSFRSVERAIAFEIERHTKVLDAGETITQETRGWDEEKGETFSQRSKEEAHDYRYFPDPDIPKFYLSEIPELADDVLRKELPELPAERRARYEDIGLSEKVGDMFTKQKLFGDFFDATCGHFGNDVEKKKMAANYLSSDIAGQLKDAEGGIGELLRDDLQSRAKVFAQLIELVSDNTLSSRGAKDIVMDVVREAQDPHKLAEDRGVLQTSDVGALEAVVKEVIAENDDAVAQVKAGNDGTIQFLVGQGMKKTQGSANPQVLRELFEKHIAS